MNDIKQSWIYQDELRLIDENNEILAYALIIDWNSTGTNTDVHWKYSVLPKLFVHPSYENTWVII